MNDHLTTIDNTIQNVLVAVIKQYNVLGTFNMSEEYSDILLLQQKLLDLRKDVFLPDERIIFTIEKDIYHDDYGILLKSIQAIINTIDISNFFILILTTNNNVLAEYNVIFNRYNNDDVPINFIQCNGKYIRSKESNIIEYSPYNVIQDIVSDYSLKLLNSDTFCILPWIQLQTDNKKNVYACCYSNRELPISEYSTDINIMSNSTDMKQMRYNMLHNIKNNQCSNCYITEKTRKTSYRMFYNQRFVHHLDDVQNTNKDGSIDIKLIAWNLQFNNLCNLKCRTCSPRASSSWVNDALTLGYNIKETEYPPNIIEQHLQHINTVEQIYFGGGEPIITADHWTVLDRLLEENRTNVELIYNTNFTQLHFKDKHIFDYWNQFNTVHVGASLDAMSKRAEYWRSGTKWDVIEENRLYMIEKCNNISFEIMPTVSIVNVLHLPDFHKTWVEQGFISANQFNIKILTWPNMFSILQAPHSFKDKIREKYKKHIKWLSKLDYNGKSINGFKSIIYALDNNDIFDYKGFWEKIREVDNIRNENLLDVFPELECLQ